MGPRRCSGIENRCRPALGRGPNNQEALSRSTHAELQASKTPALRAVAILRTFIEGIVGCNRRCRRDRRGLRPCHDQRGLRPFRRPAEISSSIGVKSEGNNVRRTILQRVVAKTVWLHHAVSSACMQNSGFHLCVWVRERLSEARQRGSLAYALPSGAPFFSWQNRLQSREGHLLSCLLCLLSRTSRRGGRH